MYWNERLQSSARSRKAVSALSMATFQGVLPIVDESNDAPDEGSNSRSQSILP